MDGGDKRLFTFFGNYVILQLDCTVNSREHTPLHFMVKTAAKRGIWIGIEVDRLICLSANF